jgi:hypothetical protein
LTDTLAVEDGAPEPFEAVTVAVVEIDDAVVATSATTVRVKLSPGAMGPISHSPDAVE